MFYWSYDNFKMVEAEFEKRIVSCESFMPLGKTGLEHGAFNLEDGSHYYVFEGMAGFHIFQVDREITEEKVMFLLNDEGIIKLIDKTTLEQIPMERIMGLPLDFYEDVIPALIHEKEDNLEPDHRIVIGRRPDDTENMVCVQEYHDGFRTVWMSQDLLIHPVLIDDNWYSLDLPEEVESLCDEIEGLQEEIIEKAMNTPRTASSSYNVFVEFVYGGNFYRMLPEAFDLHPEIFECVLDGIEKALIEMGAPYVKTNANHKWD